MSVDPIVMTGAPYTYALQSWIVLDEEDAEKLLRRMYNGKRPERIHILICLCGAWADLRKSPKAWNGWRVLPNAACPDCLSRQNVQKAREIAELYPSQAYDRFFAGPGAGPDRESEER